MRHYYYFRLCVRAKTTGQSHLMSSSMLLHGRSLSLAKCGNLAPEWLCSIMHRVLTLVDPYWTSYSALVLFEGCNHGTSRLTTDTRLLIVACLPHTCAHTDPYISTVRLYTTCSQHEHWPKYPRSHGIPPLRRSISRSPTILVLWHPDVSAPPATHGSGGRRQLVIMPPENADVHVLVSAPFI